MTDQQIENQRILNGHNQKLYKCEVCRKTYVYREDIPQKCKDDHVLSSSRLPITYDDDDKDYEVISVKETYVN